MAEVLRGELAWVGLGGLLQLTDSASASGTIHLGTAGRIGLYLGAPVSASLGNTRGVGALLDAFLLEGGPFRITDERPPSDKPLMPVMGAILEGYRIADEWQRLGAKHLKWAGSPPTALAKMRFTGIGVAAEILYTHPGGISAALDPVLKAWESGLLMESSRPDEAAFEAFKVEHLTLPALTTLHTTAPPPVATPAPKKRLGKVDFDDMLTRARKAVKNRELDLAEELLQGCLGIQPAHKVATQNLRRVRALRASQF